ncbi:hypothetical protein VTJ04DRAFT_7770 [Mycothermus thermophilus]|uniref:uncharacterized protein n=1 Tax=Humicola insolens TaxID=85995 RepID=UPI003742A664
MPKTVGLILNTKPDRAESSAIRDAKSSASPPHAAADAALLLVPSSSTAIRFAPICSSGPARISGLRDPGGLRLSNHGNAPPSVYVSPM